MPAEPIGPYHYGLPDVGPIGQAFEGWGECIQVLYLLNGLAWIIIGVPIAVEGNTTLGVGIVVGGVVLGVTGFWLACLHRGGAAVLIYLHEIALSLRVQSH